VSPEGFEPVTVQILSLPPAANWAMETYFCRVPYHSREQCIDPQGQR
jgi:hypothetical protein